MVSKKLSVFVLMAALFIGLYAPAQGAAAAAAAAPSSTDLVQSKKELADGIVAIARRLCTDGPAGIMMDYLMDGLSEIRFKFGKDHIDRGYFGTAVKHYFTQKPFVSLDSVMLPTDDLAVITVDCCESSQKGCCNDMHMGQNLCRGAQVAIYIDRKTGATTGPCWLFKNDLNLTMKSSLDSSFSDGTNINAVITAGGASVEGTIGTDANILFKAWDRRGVVQAAPASFYSAAARVRRLAAALPAPVKKA
jgi:hypothetical protein